MTTEQAARSLGIAVSTLVQYVYVRRIRPDQPVGQDTPFGPPTWTFTAEEVERFRVERDHGWEKRRRWNGCRPDWRAA